MAEILFIERAPLPLFFARRATRVLPVFLLFLAVVVPTWIALGLYHFSLSEVLSILTFLRSYIPWNSGIWESALPIGHLWSLNVEEHTYVLLALLTLAKLPNPATAYILFGWWLLSAILAVCYAKFPNFSPPSGTEGTEVASAFIVASCAIRLLVEHFRIRFSVWFFPLVTVIGSLGVSARVPWYLTTIWGPLFFSLSVNSLDSTFQGIRTTLSHRAIVFVGVASFSLYIWQQPFYKFRDNLPAGVAFVGATTVALLSFFFFEDPIRRWMNSKLRRAS
jgi:peptidoglycan/LPS O-acetylase OafA/YrhL